MAERKIPLGSKDTEIRAGNVRLRFEKDERPSVSGLRFSKSLGPLLEPIMRCRGVRVSLRPVEHIEDTINVRGRNTYLLYDPSEKTKGSVAKPKYLMLSLIHI